MKALIEPQDAIFIFGSREKYFVLSKNSAGGLQWSSSVFSMVEVEHPTETLATQPSTIAGSL